MEHVFEGHKKSAAKSQGNNIISVRTDRFDWMARGRALGPRFWWLVEMRARWDTRMPWSTYARLPLPSSPILRLPSFCEELWRAGKTSKSNPDHGVSNFGRH